MKQEKFEFSGPDNLVDLFEEAVAKPGASLIELVVSEEAISPAFTLSELIERSLENQKGN